MPVHVPINGDRVFNSLVLLTYPARTTIQEQQLSPQLRVLITIPLTSSIVDFSNSCSNIDHVAAFSRLYPSFRKLTQPGPYSKVQAAFQPCTAPP